MGVTPALLLMNTDMSISNLIPVEIRERIEPEDLPAFGRSIPKHAILLPCHHVFPEDHSLQECQHFFVLETLLFDW